MGGEWIGRRFGPYEVLEEIARGGQGAVLRARHVELGTFAAIKVLQSTDRTAALRFRQEGQVMARLAHPNLLRIVDLGVLGNLPYLILELIDGRSLSTLVREEGALAPDAAARILEPIAGALQVCHDAGVVHRDVKPANIVLDTTSQRPVLVDFGILSRDTERMGLSLDEGGRLSVSGEVKGTPSYMAPEQIDAQKVDARTDVYALGATLYHLLTGAPPYQGASPINIMSKVLQGKPPDPRKVVPRVPPGLAQLCMESMASKPEQRPASAAAFAERLSAPATSTGGGKGVLVAAVLALMLVVAGVGLMVGLLAAQGREPAETAPGPDPDPLPDEPQPDAPDAPEAEPETPEPTDPPNPYAAKQSAGTPNPPLALNRDALGKAKFRAPGAPIRLELEWKRLTPPDPRPSPRSGHGAAMVYDPTNPRVLLLGGRTGSLLDPRLWSYAQGKWTVLSEPDEARYWHAAAFDTVRKELVSFGGHRAQSTPGDASTWIHKGGTWRRDPPGGPPPLIGPSMVYDQHREQILLFGGHEESAGIYHSDLWAWDGERWTKLEVARRPDTSKSASMVRDGDKVLLFGGQKNLRYSNDLWQWDGNDWTRKKAFKKPKPRYGATFTDIGRGFLLIGGQGPKKTLTDDVWFWSGVHWTKQGQLPAALRGLCWQGACWDPARRVLLVFGGWASSNQSGELWEVRIEPASGEAPRPVTRGCEWVAHTAGPSPGPRSGHERSMVYDPKRKRVVMLGGHSDGRNLDTLWSWNGEGWSEEASIPLPRFAQAAALNVARDELVMFGGLESWKKPVPPNTSVFDGKEWKELPPGGPLARYWHCMAYDAAREQVLLCGGAIPGGGELDDGIWILEGERWRNVQLTEQPGHRKAANLVYDPKRRVTVLFGGARGKTPLNDVWTWDGSEWTQADPSGPKPPGRYGAAMAYCGEGLLLHGGLGLNDEALSDLWLWDGKSWERLKQPPSQLAQRSWHGMAWDPTHEQLVVYGGRTRNQQQREDTWIVRPPPPQNR